MESITTLKLTHSRDLLAYVPHRLGYTPEESLVLIGMCRNSGRTCLGLMVRCDLPASWLDTPDLPTARSMVENLRADTSVNAAAAVLYVDAAPDGGAPCERAAGVIRQAIDDVGFDVVDELWVAGRRWRSYACDDPDCCPAAGRDLSEVEASSIGAEMVLAGSSPAKSLNELTQLPSVDGAVAESVRRSIARVCSWRDHQSARGRRPAWRRNQLECWHAAWSAAPGALDPDRLARLTVALSDSWFRDAVLLDILGYAGCVATVLDGRQDAAVVAAMRHVVGTEGSEPEAGRIQTAEGLMRRVAAAAFGPWRAGPLAVLAWIRWCRGQSSAASSYLDCARDADPGHRLTSLLTGFVEHGLLPVWITEPR